MGNPSPNQRWSKSQFLFFWIKLNSTRTNSATAEQLSKFELKMGPNPVVFRVTTASGSLVKTSAVMFLMNNTAQLVVSDIDGTVTKSNIRGLVLPSLGISDWKHRGVVELYEKIQDQGYTVMYLSNRYSCVKIICIQPIFLYSELLGNRIWRESTSTLWKRTNSGCHEAQYSSRLSLYWEHFRQRWSLRSY